jgi:hypothetical protein
MQCFIFGSLRCKIRTNSYAHSQLQHTAREAPASSQEVLDILHCTQLLINYWSKEVGFIRVKSVVKVSKKKRKNDDGSNGEKVIETT